MKAQTKLAAFLKQVLNSGTLAPGLYGYMTLWQAEYMKRLVSDARLQGARIESEYAPSGMRTVAFGRYEILWSELCVRDLEEEARRISAEAVA